MSVTRRVLVTDYAWPSLEIEREALGKVGAEMVVASTGEERELQALAPQADAILTKLQGTSGALHPDCQDKLFSEPTSLLRDRILPLLQVGKTVRVIAQELVISRRAVQRILKGAQKPLADFCPSEAISQGPPAAFP